MAAIAVPLNAEGKLPKKMPKDMSPSEAWGAITGLFKQVNSHRREADKAQTTTERLTGALADSAVVVSSGFTVPLILGMVPKIKRITFGKSGYGVDTQAVFGGASLLGGILMAWAGWDGHRLVTNLGAGTTASWAGIKAEQLVAKWQARKAA